MWWLIVAAIALGASLFRIGLANYSLWFDEQASMFFAGQPLRNLWSAWMLREPNPPLYYSLLKACVALLGNSARAARALSIAAGAGSIVATAIFTASIFGRKAGIFAAVLTALSAQQLYFSLQVRSYELVYLAASGALISLVSIDRALRLGRASPGGLMGYAIGCSAAIYLHTTMFLLPVIGSAAILLLRRRAIAARPLLALPLLAANLAIAMAAGWWLDITVRQIIAGGENIAVFDAVTPWLVVRKTIGTLFFARQTGFAHALIASLAAGVAVRQAWRSRDDADTLLLLTVLGLTIAAMGLLSIEVPIFLPRTIFWLSIITTALCSAGLAGIAGTGAFSSLFALVALNMLTSLGARQTENWDGAIARARQVPGSRLIVQSEAMGLLLMTACERQEHRPCSVPIIAVTTADDRLDGWSTGLYSGQAIDLDHLDALPRGRYFVFRKEFYHDLLKTLHLHCKAGSLRDDPPLLGPIDRSALIG